MPVVKVVIIHTYNLTRDMSLSYLERGGLVSGQDFVIVGSGEGAEEYLSSDTHVHQLLITDSWGRNEPLVAEFVQRMLERSPSLSTASFSGLGPLKGPYNMSAIPKDDDALKNLVAFIKRFLILSP